MFSTFGNLFITRPRTAESTDTRLGIRRHETDQDGRKKKDGEKTPDELFNTDDSATVTVEALRVFLANFLQSLEPQKSTNANITTSGAVLPEGTSQQLESAPSPSVDGEARKAAGVYQHVAQKVDRNAVPQMPENSAPAAILDSEDVRTIYKLLEDLRPLSEQGIEYLTIERSDSFLNSLVAAVARAKSR